MSDFSFTAEESGFPVEPGMYAATFIKIDDYTPEAGNKSGKPLVRLDFMPTKPEHAGTVIPATATKSFKTKTKLFRYACGMAGRTLKAGDAFNFADHVGKTFLLTVGKVVDQFGDRTEVVSIDPIPQ